MLTLMGEPSANDDVESWTGEWSVPAAKLLDAADLFGEVNEAIATYILSTPLRLIEEPRWADPQTVDLFVVALRMPPLRIATRIGALLHNLRSALNAALGVIWRKGKRVDFPIAASNMQFVDWVRSCKPMPPRAVAEAIEPWQPYYHAQADHPRNVGVAILARLNNHDKHQGLTLTPWGLGGPNSSAELRTDHPELVLGLQNHLKGGRMGRRTLAYTVRLVAPQARPGFNLELRGLQLALDDYFPVLELLSQTIDDVEVILRALRAPTLSQP